MCDVEPAMHAQSALNLSAFHYEQSLMSKNPVLFCSVSNNVCQHSPVLHLTRRVAAHQNESIANASITQDNATESVVIARSRSRSRIRKLGDILKHRGIAAAHHNANDGAVACTAGNGVMAKGPEARSSGPNLVLGLRERPENRAGAREHYPKTGQNGN